MLLNSMVNVYVRLIKSGSRTIEDIPSAYRETVKKALEPKSEEASEEVADHGSDED